MITLWTPPPTDLGRSWDFSPPELPATYSLLVQELAHGQVLGEVSGVLADHNIEVGVASLVVRGPELLDVVLEPKFQVLKLVLGVTAFGLGEPLESNGRGTGNRVGRRNLEDFGKLVLR